METEILELMRSRHSVRRYEDRPVPEDVRAALNAEAAALNAESGLHMQLFFDEPACFTGRMAEYGHFENARNYIAVVGPKGKTLDETGGFYGERLVLKAQAFGLNTCWAALSHGKSRAKVGAGEKEVIVISLGYGKTPGVPHKNRPLEKLAQTGPGDPDWYVRGIEAALLAPPAINQQKFRIARGGNAVSVRTAGLGPCIRIDLGIVKCHFELAAGKENFTWA